MCVVVFEGDENYWDKCVVITTEYSICTTTFFSKIGI
jgi:hypothetical protein